MSYYRICASCGAHLDPGERCDCKREAAPVWEHRSGKVEKVITSLISTSIIAKQTGGCQG